MNCILLDNEEDFLRFLDPDLTSLEETRERYSLSSIDMTYNIDDPSKARELFKVGHKIFVVGDENLKDCLYIIPESLKHDFFEENNVEFNAEEVLTELNYIPFSHLILTTENGFTITNGAVTVNRFALEKIFGNHLEIGVIQPCLSDTLSQISPVGTMSLMELLRFIEDETSNVFVTRYEKDVQSNVIHRYLDFLNPKSKKDQWNLCFDYIVPQECESESGEMTLENYGASEESLVSDSQGEGDDDVKFPNRQFVSVDVTNFELRIFDDDELKVVFDANEQGLNGHSEEYSFDIDYNESRTNPLLVKVRGYSYSSTLHDNPNSVSDMEETDSNNDGVTSDVTLGTHLTIQLVDTTTESIVYQQKIQPIMNKTVGDVLDLGFNVENITLEIEESDTFNAVAPKISQDNEQSKTDIKTIIQRWLNLAVTKGDTVPMIVQKVTDTVSPTTNHLNQSVVNSNYYVRPLHPNDSTDSNNVSYEYLKATAYWKAPFTKLEGEIYVRDDEDTGIEYDAVYGRMDLEETDGQERSSEPKLCFVETSDEDPYAIFNDVCMKLKDKRFPGVNIEVDVKDYQTGKNNNYDIFDKVYVKIPNFSQIVIASVNKTVKNAYDIGENKVELSNYSSNSKVAPAETMIDGENPADFTYPNRKFWSITVINMEDNDKKVDWRLVSFNLQKVDGNGNTSNVNTYNVITDNLGVATLNLNYEPGTYRIEVSFGGDAEFASSSATFEFKVGGKITKSNPVSSSSASKKNKTKKVTKTSYYTKFGVSPDEKTITAIGKASTTSEKNRYGTKKFWRIKLLRKCPHCKSTKLFWGWNWGSKFRGKTEGGSSEGRIVCEKCGASYTVFGEGGKKDLTVIDKPVESSKTEAQKLKNGKLLYDSWTVNVKIKNSNKNSGGVISRSGFSCTNQTGAVKNDVKKQAKAIVKDKTGVKAAKAIVKWIVNKIKYESRDGFYQSPSKTLQRQKGNDRCICDLIMHMCDAVGVMSEGISCYYVYSVKKTKKKTVSHVFLRINGKWVDPLMKKHAWGNYKTGYGAIKKAKQTRYPCLPYARKY